MAAARPSTPSPLSTASHSPAGTSISGMASFSSTGNLTTDCLLRAKRTIKCKLIDAIKDLQVEHPVGGQNSRRIVIGNKEDASRLCHALEAMLLHGLKRQSFFGKLNQVLLGPKMGKKLPETHFWHFVLIFSHPETLETLNRLKLIKTDIGRCRAWVRHALNEGLLQSYLQTMVNDKVTCAKHYENTAFVRDPECFELATRYLLGLECYKFELATNSSLLNIWQTPSLVMAGLWIPENFQDEAPAPAEDVVALMAEEALEVSEPVTRPSFDIRAMGLNSQHSYLQRGLLNETEALKMIMEINDPSPPSSSSRTSSPLWAGATAEERRQSFHNLMRNPQSTSHSLPKSYPIPPTPPETQSIIPVHEECDDKSTLDVPTNPDADETKSCVSESIYNINSAMYKTPENPVEDTSPQTLDENIEYIIEDMRRAELSRSNTGTDTCPTPVRRRDNGQIIASSLPMSENETTILLKTVVKHVQGVNVACPRLSGFIESFNAFGSERYFDTGVSDEDYETMGFQLKKGVSVGGLTVATSQYLMGLFDQMTRIRGLGHANFQCFQCKKAVGPIFGPWTVCHYTSRYFCDDCHSGETSLIPAKVVYNWDFTKFKVCKNAKIFLKAMFIEPIIDVKTFNATLFEFAPELDEVYILRKRLHYIHAYLATCREVKVKDKFVGMLSPRTYLFDDVDKYSLQDLEQVKNGQMAKLLKQALQLGETHILRCVLCSQKGFICEVCKTPKPIYPFHLEEISQCQKCFTVFHADCSQKLETCPKCERMSARNLNWHVTTCRLNRAIFEPECLDGEDGLGPPKNAH